MKTFSVTVILFCVFLSACNEDAPAGGSPTAPPVTNDSPAHVTDTVPTGHSSSPSEFNKGTSSPAGSTGGSDSTMPTEPRNSSGRN